MKKSNIYTLLIIVTIVLTMAAGCADGEKEASDITMGEALDIGEGSVVFSFKVTDDKGITAAWNVYTDEATVGAALIDAGLIDGDVSDFGLMVKVVNGLKAEYDEDGAYWAFYIDGEYAMAGVDMTDIEQGRVYALVYEKG